MINYSELMTKARRKGRHNLIDYLRYRLQNRYALFIEMKHIYREDRLVILRDVETNVKKKVCFSDFVKLNPATYQPILPHHFQLLNLNLPHLSHLDIFS